MPRNAKHPLFGHRPDATNSPPLESGADAMLRKGIRDELETARKYVAHAEAQGQNYAVFQSAQSANRALKQARKAIDDALRAM